MPMVALSTSDPVGDYRINPEVLSARFRAGHVTGWSSYFPLLRPGVLVQCHWIIGL